MEPEQQDKGLKKSKPIRPYPRITLEACLIIGKKIRELNGGNPWSPDEVSKAIGIGKIRNEFAYFLNSSRAFGITNGTRDSATITIEPLGREIIYAGNPQTELNKKREAFFRIQLLRMYLSIIKVQIFLK